MSYLQDSMTDILIGLHEIQGRCERLIAENERLKAENDLIKSEMIAPTDSGIVRFDSMCEEFNSGKRNLVSLCCALWNSGTVAGRAEKS